MSSEGHIPRGPTASINKLTSLYITASSDVSSKFSSSQITREAVIKSVNPSEVDVKVDLVPKAKNNGIRIDAKEADLDKLRSLPPLQKLGVKVSAASKLNPPLIMHGVPAALSSQEVLSDIIKLNPPEMDNPDVTVVYMSHENRNTRACVMEVTAEIRSILTSRQKCIGVSPRVVSTIMSKCSNAISA